jgi:deoxyribodipyrimidine photolyase-related protein
MSSFYNILNVVKEKSASPRHWIYVPYDQLSDEIGPLSRERPSDIGIILIENTWKAQRRPYHKQKLALILANMRHFALEQAKRGVAVKHLVADGPYSKVLGPLAKELGTIDVMTPAERELRLDLKPLVAEGLLRFLPHEGWLSTRDHFLASSQKAPPWRMDAFYRLVRRETGLLMEAGKPLGGTFSLDTRNRKPWRGSPPAPEPLSFPSDPIKDEVILLVERVFSHHPGHTDSSILPCTKEDAVRLWSWAKRNCLVSFGPFEDAMSSHSRGLFHTRISSLMNIHRIIPRRVLEDALMLDIPLESKEGFIRQILGWREFMAHVHIETDGFRNTSQGPNIVLPGPGDGGFARWAKRPWKRTVHESEPDGGAAPSFLGARSPLPPFYWGLPSGLRCADEVIKAVWEEGYSHHITRLMVLSNLATLLGVNPREITDWFWIAYTDAYDWVVEPNVLGMGTYGLGDLFTTKPYISGSSYINRMSDFCRGCLFDPRGDCPITPLYWAFLERHKAALKANPRMAGPMAALARRHSSMKEKDLRLFHRVREMLQDGETLSPQRLL